MKTLTIRNIDEELNQALRDKVKQKGCSLNTLVVNLLKQSTGLSKQQFTKKYHDLDSLAGTWSNEEYDEFNKNISSFNQIDEDMWK
jgi:plasmid stability protein